MQVLVWAAYKGHIASDQECDAVQSSLQAERDSMEEDNGFDYEDPFLQAFFAQDDGAEASAWCHEEEDPWQEDDHTSEQQDLSPCLLSSCPVGGGLPQPAQPAQNSQSDPDGLEDGANGVTVKQHMKKLHDSILSEA